MTVASKIKQTLASMRGAQALIEQYATYHSDAKVKEDFLQSGNQIEQIIQDLEQRVKEIEFEEPQYRGY